MRKPRLSVIKAASFVLALTSASSAFAFYATLEDSWNVVMQDDSIEIQWPAVNGLKINNACIRGDFFVSLSPISSCTAFEVTSRQACRPNGDSELCRFLALNENPDPSEVVRETTRCTAYESHEVTVPRTYSVTKCVKWTPPTDTNDGVCLQEETRQEYAPVDHLITVYRTRSPDRGPEFMGVKRFDIPNCAK